MNILKKVKEKLHKMKISILMRVTIIEGRSSKCLLPNRLYIPKYYKLRMGRDINLKDPKEFSEKLNWYKMYYHDPLFTLCADKYRMREYVKMRLGEGYTVPLLAKWDKPSEINFDNLPERFVLKTNHDGGPIVCMDKAKLDKAEVITKLNEKMKSNYYRRGREWAYKNIKRCVFAEEFLDTGDDELIDYKFFCFNGEPKFLYVTNEKTDPKHGAFTYFDINFDKLPFKRMNHSEAKHLPQKPSNFDQMKKIVKELASYGEGGIPFVRVDLYSLKGKIYVGELTFYPTNGMHELEPLEWNIIVGDYFALPNKNGWRNQGGRDNQWIRATLKSN